MRVSIAQPAYLPWLGYLQRIAISDCHVVLDHVQFEKRSFTSRNKIKTPEGWCWLSVPVKTKGAYGQVTIDALEIDNQKDWRSDHWKTIVKCYGKAEYFAQHRSFFEDVYTQKWERLLDLCNVITPYLLKALEISTPLLHSSQMQSRSAKDELILDLCREAGCTCYISGPFGRDYIRPEIFQQAGIGLTYDDYQHPEYKQLWQAQFEPNMSAIDLLFNCGPESLSVLSLGRRQADKRSRLTEDSLNHERFSEVKTCF